MPLVRNLTVVFCSAFSPSGIRDMVMGTFDNLLFDPGPQLVWANILVICASVLLALFLFLLAVGG